MLAGADGSGHAAALHLYARYVYPDVQGWLPEMFGGMPFPVFYPPMFYWLGASLMRLTGCDAYAAAKALTSLSFMALPGALFFLCRRLGLARVEAATAAALAGVVACGANAASLGGIGLLGLFEVGLYTQMLGFVWFCVWCGALAHAHRSRRAALVAVASLAALVLSNVHVLPLVAAYGTSLWCYRAWRLRRGGAGYLSRGFLLGIGYLPALVVASILIVSFWLVPLIIWYPYALGEPLPAPKLFAALGAMNLVWPVCAFVAWTERRRRPALAALCCALLLAAAAAMTPLGGVLPFIPLQAWRLMSSAMTLATIPVVVLMVRVLRESLPGRRLLVKVLAACVLLGFAYIHPRQQFGSSALSAEDSARVARVASAVSALPPGLVLAEIVEPNASLGWAGWASRDLARTRALISNIAMRGRRVLWCVFREQAVSAPMNTAVSNLFSSSKEHFALDGFGLRASISQERAVDIDLRLARSIGVSYYLVKSPGQVARLEGSPDVQQLGELEGWHLFANRLPASPPISPVETTPTLAWLPAHFKSRAPDALDVFNLGEKLAFDGHEDLTVVWSQSPGHDAPGLMSQLPSLVVVIDPASVPARERGELDDALRAYGKKLSVVLLDDGSQLAAQIHARRESFFAYSRLPAGEQASEASLMDAIEDRIVTFQTPAATAHEGGGGEYRLWRTSMAYFPAWRTASGRAVWLTGQGGMAMLDKDLPSLQWRSPAFRPVAWALSLLGLSFAFWLIRRPPDGRANAGP
jgi:hypothetical protein